MNRKSILITLILILALLVTGVFAIKCLAEAFFSWGVHSFGDYAYLDYKMLCFYIDPQTMEVGDHSYFNVSGFLNTHSKPQDYLGRSVLFGHMELDGFPIPMNDSRDHIYCSMDDRSIVLEYSRGDTDSDNAVSWMQVTIPKDNPDGMYIELEDKDGNMHYAVCAWEEADVPNHYQAYLDWREESNEP